MKALTQKPRSAYLDSLPEIQSDESTEYTDVIISKVIKHDYESIFAMFDPAVVEKNFKGDIKIGTDKLSESVGWINDSAVYKLTRHFAMSDKSSIKNTYTFIVDKNGGEGRVSVVVGLKTIEGRMYLSGIQVTRE